MVRSYDDEIAAAQARVEMLVAKRDAANQHGQLVSAIQRLPSFISKTWQNQYPDAMSWAMSTLSDALARQTADAKRNPDAMPARMTADDVSSVISHFRVNGYDETIPAKDGKYAELLARALIRAGQLPEDALDHDAPSNVIRAIIRGDSAVRVVTGTASAPRVSANVLAHIMAVTHDGKKFAAGSPSFAKLVAGIKRTGK